MTGWGASNKQKPRMGRNKAQWKQELRKTENAASLLDQLGPTAAAATGAVVAAVCMAAVATTATRRAIRQKWDWGLGNSDCDSGDIHDGSCDGGSGINHGHVEVMWRYQSAWVAAGTGVSAAGVYTVGVGGWNSTGGRDVKSALAFIRHMGDKPVVTGMDT